MAIQSPFIDQESALAGSAKRGLSGIDRDPVRAAVVSFLAANPHGRLRVGYSGGRDSAVLLSVLAGLDQAHARELTAVHVDHGLHPDSADWAEHAKRIADCLDVPIAVHRVDLRGRGEVGVEARAREARREVYAQHLAPGDWMLLAHHREDQAETLMLRLLSGAGLQGLGAMREVSSLGSARIGRPLLKLPGSAVEAYAQANQIVRINDPANADPQHERSWLRAEIMPQLTQRHPELSARLARTADWLQESAQWMAHQAQIERANRQGLDPAWLDVHDWSDLPQPLRYEVLAGWLEAMGQGRPGVVAYAHIESDLIGARVDANPQLRWGKGHLRRYRLALAWVPTRPKLSADWSASWSMQSALELPARLGQLHATAIVDSAVPRSLKVTSRRGGERFRQAVNRPNRPLQHWLQELGVPPWERERLLLLADQSGCTLAILAADSGTVLMRNEALQGWAFELKPEGG